MQICQKLGSPKILPSAKNMSTECPFKCVPVVIAQKFYNDATGVPRYQFGFDHSCMFVNIWKVI